MTAKQFPETQADRKTSRVVIWATVVNAVAACVIAYAYFSQIEIMSGTLDEMKSNSRLAQMPVLQALIGPDPKGTANIVVEATEEGGSRFGLQYWVLNMGPKNAYALEYYHTLTNTDSLPGAYVSKLQNRWAKNAIFPEDVISCGMDIILRQQIIDDQRAGKAVYRHFILRYEDEFKNQYTYHTVWKIDPLVKDSLPIFGLVGRRRIDLK